MQLELASPVLSLRPGELVVLDDAAGTRISSCRGTVWVTVEGDRADHIVAPGESIVVSRGGRTLVQAMHHARICLQ